MIKIYLMVSFFLTLLFAYLENYPWLLFFGFVMITIKLNEIQEEIKMNSKTKQEENIN
jgi:hypothetical protein